MINSVFIIAMPGCGNLGDDLISQFLINLVDKKYKPKKIGVLVGENEVNYSITTNANIIYFKGSNKKSLKNYFNRKKLIKSFVKESDLIIIGGGGLLQDSHSIFTIHNYLRYIFYSKSKIMLVGIGVGPIKHSVNKYYIKKILNRSNIAIQVRDKNSFDLLKKVGVLQNIQVGCDIVEGSKIQFKKTVAKTNEIILGCNIRKWSDIDVENIIIVLLKLKNHYNINTLHFFVFENGKNNNIEKTFALEIIKNIPQNIFFNVKIFVYNETPNEEFYQNFFNVNFGLASRYHANILWQKASIPVVPIGYSPKVFTFYQKYGEKAFLFNEIFKTEKLKFISNRNSLNNINYCLPEVPANELRLTVSSKAIIQLFNILEFIYSISKSLYLRLIVNARSIIVIQKTY